MNKIAYYLLLPFFYLISYMPFRMLYLFSDFLYIVVFGLVGYRKKVVLENLRNSFPEKSEEEIKLIRKKFQRYFCDLILEIIKSLTISPASLRKHLQFNDLSLFEKYFKEKQSVVVVMGHLGNWELSGARFALEPLHTLYVIYHPLSNKYFDKLFYKMRTRLGNRLYAMNDTLRGMLRNKDALSATAFIADQTPSPDGAYWMKFLNQDTPIFTGTEKIAKKFKYPVIYISMKRIKRGLYNIEATLLSAHPEKTQEHEITELFTKRLEKDIREQPEIWLWTHRRWKHKKPV